MGAWQTHVKRANSIKIEIYKFQKYATKPQEWSDWQTPQRNIIDYKHVQYHGLFSYNRQKLQKP